MVTQSRGLRAVAALAVLWLVAASLFFLSSCGGGRAPATQTAIKPPPSPGATHLPTPTALPTAPPATASALSPALQQAIAAWVAARGGVLTVDCTTLGEPPPGAPDVTQYCYQELRDEGTRVAIQVGASFTDLVFDLVLDRQPDGTYVVTSAKERGGV